MLVRRIGRWVTATTLALAVQVPLLPPALGFSPVEGAKFNNPMGTRDQAFRLVRHLERAIDSTPPGGVIRVVTYSFDIESTADKLIEAYNRGVRVKIIVNHHRNPPATRRLKQVLGTSIENPSFLVVCQDGCRGPRPATMHAKFFTFSTAGTARRVVVVGSTNLAYVNAARHWNDLYTIVGDDTLYFAYRRLFAQMRRDRPVADPYTVTDSGKFRAYFFPQPEATQGTDVAYETLSDVRCKGATGGAGVDGRTVVRVSMFTWGGSRGLYLVRQLDRLADRGCIVQVNLGAPSRDVVEALRASSIDVFDTRVDTNSNGHADKYVHNKYFIVSGVIGSNTSARQVYTGSQNWKRYSMMYEDEVLLRISDRAVYRRYAAQFDRVRTMTAAYQ
jgi:phosphatidylserine/phosphatidylglycerophosphate/cardiolipin synthase-like enzyme